MAKQITASNRYYSLGTDVYSNLLIQSYHKLKCNTNVTVNNIMT